MIEGMNMRRRFLAAMGVVAAMALLAPVASADMIMTIDDGADGVFEMIMADGMGAGVLLSNGMTTTTADTNGIAGFMNFSGAIAGFSATVATGSSKPIIGPPAQIDLASVVISGGVGTIEVALTDTGFSPGGAGPWGLSSEFGGTTQGTISSFWTADEANAAFGIGAASGSFGPFSAGAFSASGTAPMSIPSAPFSMSSFVTVTHSGPGQITTFDSSVIVPVPGALLLGSVGLGLVGWIGNRRKQCIAA